MADVVKNKDVSLCVDAVAGASIPNSGRARAKSCHNLPTDSRWPQELVCGSQTGVRGDLAGALVRAKKSHLRRPLREVVFSHQFFQEVWGKVSHCVGIRLVRSEAGPQIGPF